MKHLATIGMAALLLSGCTERRVEETRVVERETVPAEKPQDVRPSSGEKVVDVDVHVNEQAAERQFEEKKAQFLAAASERMNQLDAKLNEMRAKARAATGEMKAETEEAIADLEEERQEVKGSLDRAKERTRSEWEKFEADVDRGLNDLERAYNDLLDRMKTS